MLIKRDRRLHTIGVRLSTDSTVFVRHNRTSKVCRTAVMSSRHECALVDTTPYAPLTIAAEVEKENGMALMHEFQ